MSGTMKISINIFSYAGITRSTNGRNAAGAEGRW